MGLPGFELAQQATARALNIHHPLRPFCYALVQPSRRMFPGGLVLDVRFHRLGRTTEPLAAPAHQVHIHVEHLHIHVAGPEGLTDLQEAPH